MSKNQIKLVTLASVLSFVAIVFTGAPVFISKAESDVIIQRILGL